MKIRAFLLIGACALLPVDRAFGQEKSQGISPSAVSAEGKTASTKFAAGARLSGEVTIYPRQPDTLGPEPDYAYEALDETKIGAAAGTLYSGHSFQARHKHEVWIVGKNYYAVCTFHIADKAPFPTLNDVLRYEQAALPLLRRAGWRGEHLWKMDHGMLKLDKGWGLVINPDLMSNDAWQAALHVKSIRK